MWYNVISSPISGHFALENQMSDTQETVLEKFKSTHGDKYDYSLVKYVDSTTKVDIICPKHGKFSQEPSSHTRGSGCKYCFRRGRVKQSQEEFIESCSKTHDYKFDYSKTVFNGMLEKIIITCPFHGDLEVNPFKHKNGTGCKYCVFDSQCITQEEFIKRSNSIHNFKYDYSKVVYIKGRYKVNIICKDHGEFLQQAHTHMYGGGCPDCAVGGFFYKKPGFFYILHSERGNYTKVGITRDLKKRLQDIKSGSGITFRLIKDYYFESGNSTYSYEQFILAHLRSKYKNPLYKFEGYTECFCDVNETELLNFIENTIANFQNVCDDVYMDSEFSDQTQGEDHVVVFP